MTQEAIALRTTGDSYPGVAVVQDVNKALATIATDFAGPDDPAALAGPYMTWADTANMLLKRRNAADSAWVVERALFRVSRPVYTADEIPVTDQGPISVIGIGDMDWDGTAYVVTGSILGGGIGVSRGSDQLIANATDTVALFDVETGPFLVGDPFNCFDVSNGRYSPKKAGRYSIQVAMSIKGSGITLASCALRINGTASVQLATLGASYNAFPILAGGLTIKLTPEDYMQITAYSASASGGNAIGAGSYLTITEAPGQ